MDLLTVIGTLVVFILVIAVSIFLSFRLYEFYYYHVRYPKRDLAGKTILITGGAAGLGRSQADRFAKLGAKLILWDVNVAQLEKSAEGLRRSRMSGSPASMFRIRTLSPLPRWRPAISTF
jgi:hypothetical protein